MAAPFVDERAPGVAPAMRRRIAAALDAGERPALRGKNLRLGSIVLHRTDGRDAPALREVELQMTRRNIDTTRAFDTFVAGTTRRGRNTYAVDSAGQERIIARRVGGENRATQGGSASGNRATRGTSSTFPHTLSAAAPANDFATTSTTSRASRSASTSS